MLWRLCLVTVVLGLSGTAIADANRDKALALFGDSNKAYKNGEFERAAALLREAYALVPEPILLYNLARALEGMGDFPGAIVAYEKYLAGEKKIEDRGALERRVQTLKDQVAAKAAADAQRKADEEAAKAAAEEQARRRAGGDPQPQEPRSRPARGHSVLPWVTIGVGGAVALTGGGFGLLARQASDDATTAPSQVRAQELDDTAHARARTATLLLAAGGAVTVGGIVWLIVDRARSRDDASTVGLVVGPGSLGIAGSW